MNTPKQSLLMPQGKPVDAWTAFHAVADSREPGKMNAVRFDAATSEPIPTTRLGL
jgi:hypothetical protein